MKKSLISKSKFLSLVLRHEPEVIGLCLDTHGWAAVDDIIQKAGASGTLISFDELKEIVDTNEKRRFDLDLVNMRIRANQGHSLAVDLGLSAAIPPEVLFHGSAVKNRASIRSLGLVKGARQHVHLSLDCDTARSVGARHGSPIVFSVASGAMHSNGFLFYRSKNDVWLSDDIPAQYLVELTQENGA